MQMIEKLNTSPSPSLYIDSSFPNNRPEKKYLLPEKRSGRPPKKRENTAYDYSSALVCHLAANKECCLSYDDSDFRVLARCWSEHNLNVLEALYVHVLR